MNNNEITIDQENECFDYMQRMFKEPENPLLVKIPKPVFKNAFDSIEEGFGTHERLYLISNERKKGLTLKKISRQPIDESHRVLIAVSGFFGLDIAALRILQNTGSPYHLVFVDISYRVQSFWKMFDKLIKSNLSRENFITKLKSILELKSEKYFTSNCLPISHQTIFNFNLKLLNKQIERGNSWLSSDEKFFAIQNVFKKNRFVFKRLDYFCKKDFIKITDTIKQFGQKLDIIYLSNLREYAEESNLLNEFHATLRQLSKISTNKTYVVDTHIRTGGLKCKNRLEQRLLKNLAANTIKKTFIPSPPAT